MTAVLDIWRRRRWQANQSELACLAQTRPATVITGGSEGIGLALARLFAKRRGAVVLIARRQDMLDAAQQQLENSRAEIYTLALDITQPDACTEITNWLRAKDLHIHELVNNAGIGLGGPYDEQALVDIDRLVELNIAALNRLTRTVLPDMLLRGRGGIINIASLGGLTPGPYQATYYASKAYVISLSRALAYETRGMGVTISCVAPGPVNTGFHARINAETALYRIMLPALSPAAVARSTLFWYKLGRKLIIPGVLNMAMAICLSLLPGFLTIPIVSILIRPRENKV